MKRAVLLISIVTALAASLASTAGAADRMWIGFHDDPMFRFDANRGSEIETATAQLVADAGGPRPIEE